MDCGSSNGEEYTGAEVTSEGFHIYGLDPYQYYSAGYACYLSDVNTMQDSWDIWDNHMSIANVKNGQIIGYKYFGFGGLDRDKNGVKSFEGTKRGNQTSLSLFLRPKTPKSFKINIWLDGPWDNKAWKGKKIGEILFLRIQYKLYLSSLWMCRKQLTNSIKSMPFT